jgi:hypothetical protein
MEYELKARVWFRESTQEWVLEIEGEIEDTFITNRHTCPRDTDPRDVPALAHLYPGE